MLYRLNRHMRRESGRGRASIKAAPSSRILMESYHCSHALPPHPWSNLCSPWLAVHCFLACWFGSQPSLESSAGGSRSDCSQALLFWGRGMCPKHGLDKLAMTKFVARGLGSIVGQQRHLVLAFAAFLKGLPGWSRHRQICCTRRFADLGVGMAGE